NPSFDVLKELGNLEAFFRAHLGLLKKEFASQKYDILGHGTMLPPLAAGKPEDHFPEWWEEELIALLLKHGVAMELSNRWKTPYDRLMEKAVKAGVMFSVGSDGHDPKKTCVLDYPKNMLSRFHIPSGRIFDVARKVEAA